MAAALSRWDCFGGGMREGSFRGGRWEDNGADILVSAGTPRRTIRHNKDKRLRKTKKYSLF